MGLESLRALVSSINFGVHGVEATVTVPAGVPVATHVIWCTPPTEDLPRGLDIKRAAIKLLLAIPKVDVAQVPRGTVVVATPPTGGAARQWIVDGTERVETDHVQVVVMLAP